MLLQSLQKTLNNNGMAELADYIVIGKVASTYGTRGWLKITSYTEFKDNILQYVPWYLEKANRWELIKIEDSRIQSKGIIVKLVGWDAPETARLLTGKKIAIQRSQLPVLSEDEYYWRDLVGLTVVNADGIKLGQVLYLIETGSNDVLVVKGETEFAIPYLLDEVITRIDLKNRVIYVNWELL